MKIFSKYKAFILAYFFILINFNQISPNFGLKITITFFIAFLTAKFIDYFVEYLGKIAKRKSLNQ